MTDKATFTKQETADFVGISMSLLNKLLNRRNHPLPSIHAGRRVLILPDQLEAWLHEEQLRREEVD